MADNIWGYRNPWDLQEEERQRQRIAYSASHPTGFPSVPDVSALNRMPLLPRLPALPDVSALPEVPDRLGNAVPPDVRQPGNILDYNDPNEINSFADIYFRRPTLNSLTGGLAALPDYITLAKRGFFKPLFEGDAAAVLLNMLTNFSETAGVFGNMVKGLAFDGVRGLQRSVNASGEGRYNYDWNARTGLGGVADFVANSALEIVSDPLNWVSLGGKAVLVDGSEALMKAAFVQGAETFAQQGSKTLAKEAVEQTAESISKRGIQYWLSGKYDFGSAFLRAAEEEASPRMQLAMALKKKTAGRVFMKDEEVRAIAEIARARAVEALDRTVYDGLRKFVDFGDAVQSGLTKAAFASNGFGLIWTAGKYGYEHAHSAITSRIIKTLKSAVGDMPNGYLPVMRIEAAQAWANAMGAKLDSKTLDPEVQALIRTLNIKASVGTEKAMLLEGLETKLHSGGLTEDSLLDIRAYLDDFFRKNEDGQDFQTFREAVHGIAERTRSPALVEYGMTLDAIEDRLVRYAEMLRRERGVSVLDIQHQRVTELRDIFDAMMFPQAAVPDDVIEEIRDSLRVVLENDSGAFAGYRRVGGAVGTDMAYKLRAVAEALSKLPDDVAVPLRKALERLKNFDPMHPKLMPLEAPFFQREFRNSLSRLKAVLKEAVADDAFMSGLEANEAVQVRKVADLLAGSIEKVPVRQVFAELILLPSAVAGRGIPLDFLQFQARLLRAGAAVDTRLYHTVRDFYRMADQLSAEQAQLASMRHRAVFSDWQDIFAKEDAEHLIEFERKFGQNTRATFGMATAQKVAKTVLSDLGMQEQDVNFKNLRRNSILWNYANRFEQIGNDYANERFRDMCLDLSRASQALIDNPGEATLKDFNSALGSFISGTEYVEEGLIKTFRGAGQPVEPRPVVKPAQAPYSGPAPEGSRPSPKVDTEFKYENDWAVQMDELLHKAYADKNVDALRRFRSEIMETKAISPVERDHLLRIEFEYRREVDAVGMYGAAMHDVRDIPYSPSATKSPQERHQIGELMEDFLAVMGDSETASNDVLQDIATYILSDDFLRALDAADEALTQKRLKMKVPLESMSRSERIAVLFEHVNAKVLPKQTPEVRKATLAFLENVRQKFYSRNAAPVREAVESLGEKVPLKPFNTNAPHIIESVEGFWKNLKSDEIENVPLMSPFDIENWFDELRLKLELSRQGIYTATTQIDILGAHKDYLIKKAQVRSFYELYNLSGVSTLVNRILSGGMEARVLQHVAEAYDGLPAGESARELLNFVEGYASVVYFVDLVRNSPVLSAPAKAALLDVFQSHSLTPFGDFSAGLARKTTTILTDMARQMKSILMNKRLSQEHLVFSADTAQHYADLLAKLKAEGGRLHDAKTDVRIVMRTFYRLLKADLPENFVPVFVDSEMTGKDDFAEFVQWAWSIGDSDVSEEVLFRPVVPPSEPIMMLLTGKDTVAEATAAYAARFGSATMDEAEGMAEMFRRMREAESALGVDSMGRQKQFQFVAHNGFGFDFPKVDARFKKSVASLLRRISSAGTDSERAMLTKRLESLRAGYEWFHDRVKLDTYQMLEDVNKMSVKFKPDEEREVREILQKFVVRRSEVEEMAWHGAGGLHERLTIPALDGDIAEGFGHVADVLRTDRYLSPGAAAEMRTAFVGLKSEVYDALTRIGTYNDAFLGTTIRLGEAPMLDAAGLPVINPLDGKVVMERAWLGKDGKPVPPGTMDGVYNITQLLRSVDTMGGLAYHAPKVWTDTEVIQNHFDLGTFGPRSTDAQGVEHLFVSNELAASLTHAGRRIERYMAGVRNITELAPLFEDKKYQDIIEELCGFVEAHSVGSGITGAKSMLREWQVIQHLKRKHADGITDYAVALYIYYKVRAFVNAPGNDAARAEFTKRFSPDNVGAEYRKAYQFLDNPMWVRGSYGNPDVMDPYHSLNYDEDSFLGEAVRYDEAMQLKQTFEQTYETWRILTDDLHREVPDTLGIQNGYRGIVEGLKGYGEEYLLARDDDMLSFAKGTRPHRVQALTESMTRVQDNMGRQMVHRMLSLSPEQLVQHLFWNCGGVVTFSQNSFKGDGEVFFRVFQAMLDPLEKRGVHVYQTPFRVWMYLDNSPESLAKWLASPEPGQWLDDLSIPDTLRSEFPKTHSAIVGGIESLRNLTGGASTGSLGIALTASSMSDVRVAAPPELISKFIPTEFFEKPNFRYVRDDGSELWDMGTYFMKPRFNFSNIGTSVEMKEVQPYISMNPYKNLLTSAKLIVPRLDARMKAKLAFYDNHMSLRQLLEMPGVTKPDLFAALQTQRRLVATAYVVNEKGKYRAMRFPLRTMQDLDNAIAMDAVLMHEHIYTKAVQVLDHARLDNNLINFWSKYVAGPMRVAMLATLGFPARNFIDSGMKTMQFADMNPNMIKHSLEMMKVYNQYVAMVREMLTDPVLVQEFGRVPGYIPPARVARFYELHPDAELPRNLFDFLHNYMVNSYSGGISDDQGRMLVQRSVVKENEARMRWNTEHPEAPRDLLPGDMGYEEWQKVLYENFWVKSIFDMNSNFEHVFRLSVFTWDILHNGATFGEASASVLRTHFDYGTKSTAMRYLETVVPFSNFTIHNTMYWADLVQSDKWYAALLADAFRPLWDQDGASIEQLETNRSLQNRILSGNLQLNDDGLTLKLNPSFMDALRTATDPVGTVRGRLMSFLGLGASGIEALSGSPVAPDNETEWTRAVLQALPLFGPAYTRLSSGIANARKTGSVLPGVVPSVFGATTPTVFRRPGFQPVQPKRPASGRLPVAPASRKKTRTSFIRRRTVNMTRTGILLTYGLSDATATRNPHIARVVSQEYDSTAHIQNQIEVLLSQRGRT